MNELNLKQAKNIGRKWAFINTITLVLCPMVVSRPSSLVDIFKEQTFLISLLTAFILSYLVGGKAVKNLLIKNEFSKVKWIVYYFFMTWFFFNLPLIIEFTLNSTLSFSNVLIWMLFFLFYTLLIGCIPIIGFGFLYSSLLENEIRKKILNKKEPKL